MILPNGSTQLLALFGTEIGLSPSPATHSLWAQQAGLNWLYLPLPCRDEPSFIRLCSELMGCTNFRGGNITNPFKKYALQLPGVELDASAELCGAANTLYRKDVDNKSVWCLANTDLVGCSETLSRILSEENGIGDPSRELMFLILGTGAMAETCAQAIALVSGHQHKTVTTKLSRAELEASTPIALPNASGSTQLVVVNTLPSGTQPHADALAVKAIETLNSLPTSSKHLFEISYLKTSASRRAQELGWGITRGDILFEEQARASFKLWARCPAPTPTTALQPSQE